MMSRILEEPFIIALKLSLYTYTHQHLRQIFASLSTFVVQPYEYKASTSIQLQQIETPTMDEIDYYNTTLTWKAI